MRFILPLIIFPAVWYLLFVLLRPRCKPHRKPIMNMKAPQLGCRQCAEENIAGYLAEQTRAANFRDFDDFIAKLKDFCATEIPDAERRLKEQYGINSDRTTGSDPANHPDN